MDRVAVIGDSAGSNSLSGRPMHVLQNSNGRYWISVLDAFPLYYGAGSALLLQFGKPGGGPGEFRRPVIRSVLPGDSTLISDLFTLHVLAPDLSIKRSLKGRENLYSLAVLHWPDNVLGMTAPFDQKARTVRTVIARYDLSGDMPVLIDTVLDTGPNNGRGVEWANSHRDFGLPGPNGDVWISNQNSYHLVRYSPRGDPLDSVQRRPRWLRGGEPVRIGGSRLIANWMDSTGYLWVLGAQARRDPREVWEELTKGSGGAPEMRASALPAEYKLYRTVIEVIDLHARRVVARHLFDGYITAVLPGQRVASYVESELGIPILSIYRLKLEPGK